MKIAFLVLLMAAAVFALWDDRGGRRIKHTPAHHPELKFELDCKVSMDCDNMCGMQCYEARNGMCIDGTCFCEVEGDEKKKK